MGSPDYSSRQSRLADQERRSRQMKTQLRPPAIRGRRAWKEYLAANPSVTQVGKDSSGTLWVDMGITSYELRGRQP